MQSVTCAQAASHPEAEQEGMESLAAGLGKRGLDNQQPKFLNPKL